VRTLIVFSHARCQGRLPTLSDTWMEIILRQHSAELRVDRIVFCHTSPSRFSSEANFNGHSQYFKS
jgi:hypothetical protein